MNSNNFGTPLTGRKALISGGTTGIGRAVVELLTAEGAKVATFARTERDIEELRAALPDVLAFVADAADWDQMRGVVDATIGEFQGLDLLVNNAGVAGESIADTDYETWKSVVEINLLGPMMLTQIALDRLEPGSHIVTIGSLSAKSRGKGSDVYVATKTGLRGFTDSIGKTLAERGILQTLIEPGKTEADMTTEGKSEAEVAQAKADHQMMEAEDIARAVLYAASQPSHMVVTEMQIRPRMRNNE